MHSFFCVIHVIPYTATKMMIKNLEISVDPYSFFVSWTRPQYLPKEYQYEVSCREWGEEKWYFNPSTQYHPSDTVNVLIQNLTSGSICTFKLMAVYNPASIDDGISTIIQTTPTNKTFGMTFNFREI